MAETGTVVGNKGEQRLRFRLAEGVVAVVGLLAAILAFHYIRGVEHERAQALFLRGCQHYLTSLRHTLEDHEYTLKAMAGYFVAEPQVGHERFEAYAGNLIPLQQGLFALVWAPLTTSQQRPALEAQGRRVYGPDFQVVEQGGKDGMIRAGERPLYAPVLWVVPLETNRKALGYDLLSNPSRRSALEEARDSGQIRITRPLVLVTERGSLPGFLAFLPVYRDRAVPATLQERQAKLEGFCAAVFRYEDMIDRAFEADLPEGIDTLISDETFPTESQYVYFHSVSLGRQKELPPPGADPIPATSLVHAENLEMGGRVLHVKMFSQQGFRASQETALPWLLSLGFLMGAALLVLFLGRTRLDMERIREAGHCLSEELDLRRRAEEEIRSLARFTSDDPDPILRVGLDGHVLYANQAASPLLAAWSTAVGQPLPPEWRAWVVEGIAQGRQNEKEASAGQQVYSLLLVPFSQSGYVNLYGRDISGRKSAEQALRDSQERYRDLVEAIPEGLVVLDQGAVIYFCNQPLLGMLGKPESEILGRALPDFLDEANSELFWEQWDNLRAQGELQPFEISLPGPGGGALWVLVYTRGLVEKGEGFTGAIQLITDVTQRKIMQGQLMQAQKLESMGQLAAGIAHEINTPTQYVTDNTRFLRDSLGDLLGLLDAENQLVQRAKDEGLFPELLAELEAKALEVELDYLRQEVPVSIEQTLEGLERISNIVRSMKEFAHPGSENKAPVDLNKAIANTITVARNEWKYVAEMETDLDPDLPTVPCVAGEINQVVLNIIVNAAHAIGDVLAVGGGEKGTIRVATRLLEGQAEIRISDTGGGIPPQVADRVFDPFFTTKDPGKGTGQGLAIAHTVIVDKHQGSIAFESKEGQGTTFVIRLPLVDPQAAQQAGPDPA